MWFEESSRYPTHRIATELEHSSSKYITMSHRTKALLKIIIVGDSK